jgi:hypothetical protein
MNWLDILNVKHTNFKYLKILIGEIDAKWKHFAEKIQYSNILMNMINNVM